MIKDENLKYYLAEFIAYKKSRKLVWAHPLADLMTHVIEMKLEESNSDFAIGFLRLQGFLNNDYFESSLMKEIN